MATNYYEHKRHLILNLINHLGPISRTELITFTDYRPATVSALIKDMLEEGLIREAGFISNGPGRKRELLEINHNHICAIGISVSSASITYMVTQINGEILQEIKAELPPDRLPANLTEQIADQVCRLLKLYSDKKIIGIGICDPLYDPARYKMQSSLVSSYTHFSDWERLELKPHLEKVVSVPVSAFSAVTMPALAEQQFGQAKGARDFICIELSNGIGSSICCNGIPVGGHSGVAGEIGHTVIGARGQSDTICYCGKPGCVEADTAFPALAHKIQAALKQGVFSSLNAYYDGSRELTVQDLRRALDEGDLMCRFYVRQSASLLGVAIANMVNILNPELVILHGFMLELGDYFLDQLSASLRENVVLLARDFEIRTSSTLENILPLGATAELFTRFLKSRDYGWVYAYNPEQLKNRLSPTRPVYSPSSHSHGSAPSQTR